MTNADTNIDDEEGVVIHEHFDASKEELWETITDPDELSAWLAACAHSSPESAAPSDSIFPTTGSSPPA